MHPISCVIDQSSLLLHVMELMNKFHITMHLFRNTGRSQKTSKSGKNEKVADKGEPTEPVTDVLTTF